MIPLHQVIVHRAIIENTDEELNGREVETDRNGNPGPQI